MTITQIDERLTAIRSELETGDLAALEKETAELVERRSIILAEQERRQRVLSSIAEQPQVPVAEFSVGADIIRPQTPERRDVSEDEYTKHFMEFVCRGVKIPMEQRNAFTTTSDASAVIPTTIANEIIKQASVYGNLFAQVRKLNIQGGVDFPILSLKPTAAWITETKPSDSQSIQATSTVNFGYHGLECRIAQSLLVSVVTIEEFRRQFVPLAVEAMVVAIEKAIIRGSGVGQMKGILNDERVAEDNKIEMTAAEVASFSDWKSKVFAKMKKAYRDGVFIMAQGTFDAFIDGLVDANGQPIGRVNYGIDGAETYRFGGRLIEIVEDDLLPAFGDANVGEAFCIYMKPSDYAINTNMGLTITHWEDPNDNQVKNKCTMILDGKLLDTSGVLVLKKG
ncbi:MAG: phage major capsid protein [Turicibacter sp.]|nr:phage major capsid protein [Turicibacter sp.]